jgi:hypothetical protein
VYTICMLKNILKVFATTSIVVAFAFFLVGSFIKIVNAGTGDHVLSGYAWSSNIGWISLNCSDRGVCGSSDYKVIINPSNGTLTGYAWSSNIGWISFQETSGCPSGSNCRPKAILNSNGTGGAYFPHIIGWARAVSATSITGGAWDGWISLSCYNTSICGSSNFGVKIPNNGTTMTTSGGSLSGYAWGSTVTGWIDFSGVTLTPGSSEIDLTSDVTEVAKAGDTVNLTWSSPSGTAYTSCTGSGGDTDWNISLSTSLPQTLSVKVPSDPTVFKIECTTAGGQVDSDTVSIDINYVWDLALVANPETILAGDSSTLTWATSGNVPSGTTCEAYPTWTTKKATSGSDIINNILMSVSEAYRCTPPSPDVMKTATAKIKVLSLSKFSTDSCYKQVAGGPTISWAAANASSCVITDPLSNDYVVGASGVKVFKGGAGTYTIECTGGDVSVSGSLSTTQCNPDYIMSPVTSCSGKAGAVTDNAFDCTNPASCKAVVHINSTPEQGYSKSLQYSFTKPGSWPIGVTTNWVPSNAIGQFVSGPAILPVDLQVFGSQATITNWLKNLKGKTETFQINAAESPSNSNPKSANFTICAPDGGNSKPIFIEQ